MKTINKNNHNLMIKEWTHTFKNTVSISTQLISFVILCFWEDIFAELPNRDNTHLMLLCKVKFVNNEIRTLAELRKVNYTDKELFKEYLFSRLGVIGDAYKDVGIVQIKFEYIIREGLANDDRALIQNLEYSVNTYSYNNYKLPLSMDPQAFGEIYGEKVDNNLNRYVIKNGNQIITIESDGITNSVHYASPIDLKFNDTRISDSVFLLFLNK